jgi:tRNA-dihydrouridine synthase A
MEARGKLRPVSIAPMMDRTDRHYRFFMRQITRHTLLYTEMVTCKALLHGDLEKLLGFHPSERPLSLQIGGDSPVETAACAKLAAEWGYDEINLNVGCPSSRVQSGNFGACLMSQPGLVADCVAAMREVCPLPVTVKHRIGIDDLDRYDDMANFVRTVSEAGADRFSVHARKAWLSGLSPKENRNVPPLRYADVYRLKQDFPHLAIEINGGVATLEETAAHLGRVDAVMIGRAAYDSPWLFSEADARFFGEDPATRTRAAAAAAMIPYLDSWMSSGGRMMSVTRHMLQLFKGIPGSRRWKRSLGEASSGRNPDPSVLAALVSDPLFLAA